MLFNKIKKTNVQYGIYTDTEIPSSIFPDIKKVNTNNNLKCPAVNTSDNKLFEVNSFIEVEIDIEYDEAINKLDYKYTFDDTQHPIFNEVHSLIKSHIVIGNNNNQHTIQIILPYIFITDDKDLELTVLDPSCDTKNLKFISGGFNIYSWPRGLNLAYSVIDKNKTAKINLSIEQPILKYYFSKPISLKYINFNQIQLDFIASVRNATFYKKNAAKLYKRVLSRPPKKLLQKNI